MKSPLASILAVCVAGPAIVVLLATRAPTLPPTTQVLSQVHGLGGTGAPPPDQIVNLDSDPGAWTGSPWSVPANGSFSIFTVPAGRWLIITDYNFPNYQWGISSWLRLVCIDSGVSTVRLTGNQQYELNSSEATVRFAFPPGSSVSLLNASSSVQSFVGSFSGYLTSDAAFAQRQVCIDSGNFNPDAGGNAHGTQSSPLTVFTVPGSNWLVLTDLSATGAEVLQDSGGTVSHRTWISGSVHYKSGVAFPPGSVLELHGSAGTGDYFAFHFTGYLVD